MLDEGQHCPSNSRMRTRSTQRKKGEEGGGLREVMTWSGRIFNWAVVLVILGGIGALLVMMVTGPR